MSPRKIKVENNKQASNQNIKSMVKNLAKSGLKQSASPTKSPAKRGAGSGVIAHEDVDFEIVSGTDHDTLQDVENDENENSLNINSQSSSSGNHNKSQTSTVKRQSSPIAKKQPARNIETPLNEDAQSDLNNGDS